MPSIAWAKCGRHDPRTPQRRAWPRSLTHSVAERLGETKDVPTKRKNTSLLTTDLSICLDGTQLEVAASMDVWYDPGNQRRKAASCFNGEERGEQNKSIEGRRENKRKGRRTTRGREERRAHALNCPIRDEGLCHLRLHLLVLLPPPLPGGSTGDAGSRLQLLPRLPFPRESSDGQTESGLYNLLPPKESLEKQKKKQERKKSDGRIGNRTRKDLLKEPRTTSRGS